MPDRRKRLRWRTARRGGELRTARRAFYAEAPALASVISRSQRIVSSGGGKAMRPTTAIALAAIVFAACTGDADATTVFVTSVSRSDVQIIVNGSAVRRLAVGQSTPEGVRLLDIRDGAAILEIDRRQVALSIGQATSSEMVIPMARDGTFRVTAYINGRAVPAIIDTGATFLSMSARMANSLGIQYTAGRAGATNTANGSVN